MTQGTGSLITAAVEGGDDSVAAWIVAAMAEKLKKLTPEDARLQRLAILDDMLAWGQEKHDLLKVIETGDRSLAHANVDVRDPEPEPEGECDESLARIPLGDAVLKFLKKSKDPQTAKQIALALQEAGREFESANPTLAVYTVLKKKLLPANKDVFHIGWGKWHLKSNHYPAKVKKLINEGKSTAGTGGRSAAEHGELTRAGVERRRAKGLPVGKPLSLTAEQYTKYLESRQEGMSKGAAMRAIGMSVGTIYNYENRFDLASWNPGDPWPPPEKGSQPEAPPDEAGNVVRFAKASNE